MSPSARALCGSDLAARVKTKSGVADYIGREWRGEKRLHRERAQQKSAPPPFFRKKKIPIKILKNALKIEREEHTPPSFTRLADIRASCPSIYY